VKHWPTLIIFGMQQNDCSFAHFTLILLLRYIVKYISRSLAVYNNEFILGSACCLRKSLWDHKIIENMLLIKHWSGESGSYQSWRSTNWNDTLTASGPLWVTRLLNVLLSSGIKVYALAFVLEAHILSTCSNRGLKMMWYDTCDFLRHFKFPKVVQAHTLGEVGILGIVLIRVYSGTILPIFIEIGSYLTDKEQK